MGTSTYLIAWVDERPTGHAEIRWNGFLVKPLPH